MAKIDLHGLSSTEALEMLENLISKSIIAGEHMIEVVHGKGSGILKNAVHKYCKESSVVSNYVLDQNNPGITRIYI